MLVFPTGSWPTSKTLFRPKSRPFSKMPCFPRQPKAPTCAGCGPRCTTGSSATADANGPPSSTAHSNPSARTAPTSLRDAVSGRSSFANVTTPAKTGSLVGPTSSTTSWTTCNEPTKICLLTRSPTQRRIFGRYQRARWLERSGALGQNFATQAVGERSTAMARPPANMRVRRMALHGPEISAYLAPSTAAATAGRTGFRGSSPPPPSPGCTTSR
jgi:hypothetical protein